MSHICLSACLCIFASVWASEAQSQSSDQIIFNICNRDGDYRIAATFVDTNWAGAIGVDGWYRIPPNTCLEFRRWSSDYGEHSVIFSVNGQSATLDFGRGWRGTESYCVSPDGSDYSDTVLDPGRSKGCRGNEELTPASYRTNGAPGTKQEIHVGPFSDLNSGKDGDACVLGVCFKMPF